MKISIVFPLALFLVTLEAAVSLSPESPSERKPTKTRTTTTTTTTTINTNEPSLQQQRQWNNKNVPSYTRRDAMRTATLRKGRIPYGEESRKYRRTIFTHDDWVRHRNTERVVSNLRGMFMSGVVRQLRKEVTLVSTVSALVVAWNTLAIELMQQRQLSDIASSTMDFSSLPLLVIPSLPFTLSSPALGLLLVFRTNASYGRWMEARTTWARVVSNCRNMVRMSASLTDLSNPFAVAALEELQLSAWLYCRTLMNQVSGPPDDEAYMHQVKRAMIQAAERASNANRNYPRDDYFPKLGQRLFQSSHPNVAVLAQLSVALQKVPMDSKARVETDKSIVLLGDCTSLCEKIYSWPVPLVYTRHTARFLGIWMLLLPLALYPGFVNGGAPLWHGVATVPACAVVSIFLFGIEELAFQLEEPFSIMPLQEMCDDVLVTTSQITEWCMLSSVQSTADWKDNNLDDKSSE